MPSETFNPTAAAQANFADYVRNPAYNHIPEGMSAEGLNIYRRLINNNMALFLNTCFSDSNLLIGMETWEKLCRRFLHEARPSSPFFNDIPQAFVNWLHTLSPNEKPSELILAMMQFEADLLHAETALQTLSDGIFDANYLLKLADTARLRPYTYAFLPDTDEEAENGASHILTWRAANNQVSYRLFTDAASILLLQHFYEQENSLNKLAAELSELLPQQDCHALLHHYLPSWFEEGILIAAASV